MAQLPHDKLVEEISYTSRRISFLKSSLEWNKQIDFKIETVVTDIIYVSVGIIFDVCVCTGGGGDKQKWWEKKFRTIFQKNLMGGKASQVKTPYWSSFLKILIFDDDITTKININMAKH